MHLDDQILAYLQNCMAPPVSSLETVCCRFPLGEFLYAVLSNGTEYSDDYHSLEYLPKLIEEYRQEHPDCKLTADDLFSEGWLTPFMDQWDFSLYPRPETPELDSLLPEQKKRVELLYWLRQKKTGGGGPFVPRFRETLQLFRTLFPEMPNEEWFIQEGFLSEDRTRLSHRRHGDRNAESEALVCLWTRKTGRQDPVEADRWLDLALSLDALHSAFERLDPKGQYSLLERIIVRMEAGRYPDVALENRRIALACARDRGFCPADDSWRPLSGDLMWDLQSFDNYGFEWNLHLDRRRRIVCSYLQILCNHLHDLSPELLSRAAVILRRLASIGCLSEIVISPASVICLWSRADTSLLACERMFSGSLRKPVVQEESFKAALRQIVEKILLDGGPCRPRADGHELMQLLRFFACRSPAGQAGRVSGQALTQLLAILKRRRQDLEPQLAGIVRELTQHLEQTDNDMIWCRMFRLACCLMQEVYYHNGQLATRDAPSCYALGELLFTQYIRIFRENSGPLERSARYLDTSCFNWTFWSDIYQERRDSLLSVSSFLQPDLMHRPGNQDHLTGQYRCKIHLSVLNVLLQNSGENDTALERVLAGTVFQALLPENDLLSFDSTVTLEAMRVMEASIQLLDSRKASFDAFFDRIECFGLPELALIVHATKDDALKERCLQLIQVHVDRGGEDPNIFSREALVQIILEEQLEPLYPMTERILVRCLERCKNFTGGTFKQERDWADGQLNRLWLLRGELDRILAEGRIFYRAIVLMESEKHRNLDEAERIWVDSLNKSLDPGCVINLIYTYQLQYEEAEQAGRVGARYCSRLLGRVAELRERVEESVFDSWSEEGQKHYALNLYFLCRKCGKAGEAFVLPLCQKLGLEPKQFERTRAKPEQAEPSDLVLALRQYAVAPLAQKARWFFQSKSCPIQGKPEYALLLWCALTVCHHLTNFGIQLVVNRKLKEDRCTQLFRELFNELAPNMFGLTANDQEQTGPTGNRNKNGEEGTAEVDVLIKDNGISVAIVEALLLEKLDKGSVYRHIHQLLGNNIQKTPMFLLSYCFTDDPEQLWLDYREYIQNTFVPEFQDRAWGPCAVTDFIVSEDFIPDLFSQFSCHRHMLRMTFEPNRQVMYHILVNVGSRENLPAAWVARGNAPEIDAAPEN